MISNDFYLRMCCISSLEFFKQGFLYKELLTNRRNFLYRISWLKSYEILERNGTEIDCREGLVNFVKGLASIYVGLVTHMMGVSVCS